MNCSIRVGKTNVQISFAVTVRLICAFVFAYADCWFSHEAAQLPSSERNMQYFIFVNGQTLFLLYILFLRKATDYKSIVIMSVFLFILRQ